MSTETDPFAEVKAALAAVTVHLLVNPNDEATVRAAASGRRDLPPLEIHVSTQPAPPQGQMYVWTGDQMSGNYSIHATLATEVPA